MAVFFCAVLLLLPLFLLSGCLASDVRSGSQPEAEISMAEDGESEAAGSTPAASTDSDGYLRVHFIDVGQSGGTRLYSHAPSGLFQKRKGEN